ncbi:hypothetical protein BJX65DRAFT_65104 [Aspergillus insuetus]
MEKAHGAVFCLRFSRIGYPGQAFHYCYLISDFPVFGCLHFSNSFLSLVLPLCFISWIPTVVLGYLKTAPNGVVGCRTSNGRVYEVRMAMPQESGKHVSTTQLDVPA